MAIDDEGKSIFIHWYQSEMNEEWGFSHGMGLRTLHGTPLSDEEYLLEKVTPHEVQLNNEHDIAQSMKGCKVPVAFCGHSHIPRIVRFSNETIIVNLGSVGLPA